MNLAVCLLTCDRPELTERTLASFTRHNPDCDARMLHADDASTDDANMQIAAAHGFRTVHRAKKRSGPGHALRAMWGYAVRKGCTHILHLENDWEWVAPFPTDIKADCIRLYGNLKQQSGPRAKTGKHILGTNELIDWTDMPDRPGWQSAIAHWGGPPSITRADLLLEAAMAVKGSRRIQEISQKLNRIETARPLENIVWHIG